MRRQLLRRAEAEPVTCAALKLPDQPGAQLDLPWVNRLRGNQAEAGADRQIRCCEGRSIRRVECFHPQVEVLLFVEIELLGQRSVQRVDSIRSQIIKERVEVSNVARELLCGHGIES